MDNHHQIIERYQILYEKNPRSKVFAPLAESYMKVGLLQAALDICEKGVKIHPHFPSGHIALAKAYLAIKELDKAIVEFKKVIELAPDNLLAHKLLARAFQQQNQIKPALRTYKILLFLNSKDKEAIEKIRELEKLVSQTNEDAFEMRSLENLIPEQSSKSQSQTKEVSYKKSLFTTKRPPAFLERTLSLVDAYIQRNDVEWALKTLEEAENRLGSNHPEIKQRIRFLSARPHTVPPPLMSEANISSGYPYILKKVAFLKKLLARIEKNAITNLAPQIHRESHQYLSSKAGFLC